MTCAHQVGQIWWPKWAKTDGQTHQRGPTSRFPAAPFRMVTCSQKNSRDRPKEWAIATNAVSYAAASSVCASRSVVPRPERRASGVCAHCPACIHGQDPIYVPDSAGNRRTAKPLLPRAPLCRRAWAGIRSEQRPFRPRKRKSPVLRISAAALAPALARHDSLVEVESRKSG